MATEIFKLLPPAALCVWPCYWPASACGVANRPECFSRASSALAGVGAARCLPTFGVPADCGSSNSASRQTIQSLITLPPPPPTQDAAESGSPTRSEKSPPRPAECRSGPRTSPQPGRMVFSMASPTSLPRQPQLARRPYSLNFPSGHPPVIDKDLNVVSKEPAKRQISDDPPFPEGHSAARRA